MPRDLDSTLLRTFVTVVETGSVSGAARILHRTQAAVSMALRRLEDEVGQRLLERSPRGVKPTTAGRVLLPYAQKLLGTGLAALDALDTLDADGIRGPVRLGIPEDIAASPLPRALRQFSARFPGVALDITVDASAALSRQLAENALDFAIGDPALIHAAPLATWQHPLCWAAARGWETDWHAGRHANRTNGEPLPIVAFGGTCAWQENFFSILRKAGMTWRVACTSTSLRAIQSAVEAGLGIAVLLDWTVQRDTMRALDPQSTGLPVPPVAEFGLFRRADANSHASATSAAAVLQQFLLYALQPGLSAKNGVPGGLQ